MLGSFDKSYALVEHSIKGEELYTWPAKVRVEDLAVSPDGRWLIAMDDTNQIHVYDFATRDVLYVITMGCRITSISISKDSKYLLINKADAVAELINITAKKTVQKYKGHSGGEFTIRSGLGGANESFVICGSEGKASICMTERLSLLTDRTAQMVMYQFTTCPAVIALRIWMHIDHVAMPWPGVPQIHNYGHRLEMMPKLNCKRSLLPRLENDGYLTGIIRWSSKDRRQPETGHCDSRIWGDE